MSDDNATQHTVALADLSVPKIRDENEQVAEEIDKLEGRVEELQAAKAEAEADVSQLEDEVASFDDEKQAALDEQAEQYDETISELEAEVETKDEIIEEIREAERQDALDRLQDAYAAATGAGEDDVSEKLAEFEDAPKATVEAATEGYEVAAERTQTQSANVESAEEDLGGTAETASANSAEERKQQIAEEMGVADVLEGSDDLAPQGFEIGPGGDEQ